MKLPLVMLTPVILASSILTGCTDPNEYPSLSPRPIEQSAKAMLDDAPPTPVPVTPSQPAFLSEIAHIVAEAERAATQFDSVIAAERAAIRTGSGAVMGSENWVVAQVAQSRVEHERGPVKAALANLEDLSRAMMAKGPSADQAAFDAALARVQGIDLAQSEALSRP